MVLGVEDTDMEADMVLVTDMDMAIGVEGMDMVMVMDMATDIGAAMDMGTPTMDIGAVTAMEGLIADANLTA